MRFISAILITPSLGTSESSDMLSSSVLTGGRGGAGAFVALGTDKPRPDTPPGHCEPPKGCPKGLLKKSEIIYFMPENTAGFSPLWIHNSKLVKAIWNANVGKTVDKIPFPTRDSKKLASNLASSVWKEGDRVLKFEINCGAVQLNNDPRRARTALANEQTLLMEYIVSELVCKIVSGVCPEIFSISEAAEVGAEVFTSLELTTERKDREYCIGKSMYRLIEEEFVGPSVSKLFKDVSPNAQNLRVKF